MCLFRNARPASAPLQSQILEFFLLASSGHGLQDACTVPRCSCRGKAPVNNKPWSLGRAAQVPRCQSWRQEVTRSVGPPQKLNTKIRKKVLVFPWRNSNVLGQHTAVLHQNHQFCGFPLGLSMKQPNYPRFLIREPTQINSAAVSCSAEANPSEQLCNLFLTKGTALSNYILVTQFTKMWLKCAFLTYESGTQNSPSSHQDPLNWPFLVQKC